ncbi:MAG: ketoacyl-ACP synthase III [Clostridia bacterium]|nr:ketoacyl-ACP synthase III [Clostridia bacterium]
MKTVFKNKRVAGILTVLPQNEALFEDEVGNYSFPEKQTLRLKKVMGYEKHRIAKPETASSDLALYGLSHLLEKGLLKKEEIGAVLVVTLTPDHFLPHVSNILHGKLGLSREVVCMDILQGCCGFMLGMMQGFTLLDYMPDKKVVLVNADVLSHKISKQDRNSYPLIGDAATVTILENQSGAPDMYFNLLTDGTGRDALGIPAGGSRMPCTPETAVIKDDGEGNFRSLDNMYMNGTEVLQFVLREVPLVIDETLAYAGVGKEKIEYFLFHQPNRFMMRKLAERAELPFEKLPMNIVEAYGNASGASIPMDITENFGARMCREKYLVCLSAFGAGWCWSAAVTELGNMDFCETVTSSC